MQAARPTSELMNSAVLNCLPLPASDLRFLGAAFLGVSDSLSEIA